MRVLLFANNRVGFEVTRCIKEQGDEIVGLVVHPTSRRKYGDEIIAAAGAEGDRVFDGSRLEEPGVVERLAATKPEIGVSAFFTYIIRKNVIDLMSKGCVNLHPAYLPFNRGSYPNIWSIIDRTPAGASLHYIDEGIDTGDLIARRQVEVLPSDTGASLYRRLEEAVIELFIDTWPAIRAGKAPRIPQDPDEGTYHRYKDVDAIDEIDLDKTYLARDLIDVIRARTFPPYPGAYFVHEGRKVFVRLELYEKPLEEND